MTMPRDVAHEGQNLAEVARLVRGCTACPELASSRSRAVPGTFPPGARVLLVGGAPEAEEDGAGEPFVGSPGELLDELLVDVGLDRDRVAVTNVVKCRPANDRKPANGEMGRCRTWLERQVELADPRVICVLGATAARWALQTRSVRIASTREQLHSYAGRPLVVTYHPSEAARFGPDAAPRARLREDLGRVAELAG